MSPVAQLRGHGCADGAGDAGGDLRVFGAAREGVSKWRDRVRTREFPLELSNAALAASGPEN